MLELDLANCDRRARRPARRPRSPTPPPNGRGQPATRPASCSPASAPATTARCSRPIQQSTSSSGSRGRCCRCSSKQKTTPASHMSGSCSASGSRTSAAGTRTGRTRRSRQLRHARLAGRRTIGLFSVGDALVFGPRPADEALRTLDALLPENPHPWPLLCRAWLLTMLARFDEADQIAREASDRLRDLTGDDAGDVVLGQIAATAGRHEDAAAHLRRYCDMARGPRPARLSLDLRADAGPLALRARTLRRGRTARPARPRARRAT